MHFVVRLYSGLTLPVIKFSIKATAQWDLKLQNKDANPFTIYPIDLHSFKKISSIDCSKILCFANIPRNGDNETAFDILMLRNSVKESPSWKIP